LQTFTTSSYLSLAVVWSGVSRSVGITASGIGIALPPIFAMTTYVLIGSKQAVYFRVAIATNAAQVK
jgi:hypothetical protein